MRVRPTPDVAIDFQSSTTSTSSSSAAPAFLNLSLPRFSLGDWTRSVRLAEDPAERTVGSHTVRGSLFELLPKRLFVEGSADYDLVRDTL